MPYQFIVHGFFSPNIPKCFVLEDKGTYPGDDIVAPEMNGPWKVVVEGFKEVGRHFITLLHMFEPKTDNY